MSEEDAITLNFSDQINDTEKLAIVYLLGAGLEFIWECRSEKKTTKKKRYVNIATLMSNMIM